MSNCKFETSNGRCGLKDCYAYRHKCFTEDLCKCHEPKTNADRIRAMSDEEFAKYLIECRDDWGDYVTPNCEFYDTYEEALEATIKWLQQPADKE